MDEEEEIPVKYRLRGETEWVVKKEAVMTLGKTQWAIRLKMCRHTDTNTYYTLHVALLTSGHVARAQIKCHREGEEKPDWLQEYTFGGFQTVLVHPSLMKIDQKDKVTFVVELKLLWDKEVPYDYPKEISFPNADFTLKCQGNSLKVDSEYLKRRAPLLGYMFEDEEKKEFQVPDDVTFEDLVDAFGVLQHHWDFGAQRLLHLIPIARKLGFDTWGKSLNREFQKLVFRADPVRILPVDGEIPEIYEFDKTMTWQLDDVSQMTSSSSEPRQNIMVASSNGEKMCIIYVYTQQFQEEKYVSIGFQMTRGCDVEVVEDEEEQKFMDIRISIRNPKNGDKLYEDVIRNVFDEENVVVGSPVFAKFEKVLQYTSDDDKLFLDIDFVSIENPNLENYSLPGVTDGQIVCEGRTIHVNRQYLSHHSDYFRGLFSKHFKEGSQQKISLPAEQFDTFTTALELIYNRRHQNLTDIQISRILDCADRTWMSALTEGLQFQLWNMGGIEVEDKKWLAEQFMLPDLEVKCSMEQQEATLKLARISRKRTRPAEFQDDPPAAPPRPEIAAEHVSE